jgi:hypothetical protein
MSTDSARIDGMRAEIVNSVNFMVDVSTGGSLSESTDVVLKHIQEQRCSSFNDEQTYHDEEVLGAVLGTLNPGMPTGHERNFKMQTWPK